MKYALHYARQLREFAGKRIYLYLLFSMTIGLLDGLGILLLLPLLGATGLLEHGGGMFTGLPIAAYLQQLPLLSSLLLVLLTFALLTIGQSLLQRSQQLREVRLHTGFVNHLRLKLYDRLLHAGWGFLARRRSSDLLNALTGELGRATSGAFALLQLLSAALFVTVQVALSMVVSLPLTLLVMLCGLTVALLSRRYIRQAHAIGHTLTELSRSYMRTMMDQLNGLRDIKLGGLEQSRHQWLEQWSHQAMGERVRSTVLHSQSQLFYKSSSTLIIVAFIGFAVWLKPSQLAQLIVIVVIFSRLWPRFTGIQSILEQVSANASVAESLVELEQEAIAAHESRSINTPALTMKESLSCRRLKYRYDKKQDKYAVNDISICLPVGSMTAIVGASGAGKSTLADLLTGLLEAESGELLVDGAVLDRAGIVGLRQAIAYVSQEPFLFHDTIRANLLLDKQGVSEEDIWSALAFAAAEEFVAALPSGLDTVIGDRGLRLSGGERQRLVLARAILRKPMLLVLDEATSALDGGNEAVIQEALLRLKGRITIVVIAHRLSTIRSADQVLVVREGKVVQQGSYATLALDKEPVFGERWYA